MNKINSYISDKFPLAFAHPLKRYFIPAAGIAGSHLGSNAEILINNRGLRNFGASD